MGPNAKSNYSQAKELKSPDIPFEIIDLKIESMNLQLAQPVDPDKLFEDLLKKDSMHDDIRDERIPYWGELWPSALGLSEFMVKNPELLEGRNILEIGCGLGLPGIVAGKLGGKVTMTDYIQEAVDFAAYNWSLNSDDDCVSYLLDWRNPKVDAKADVLLASDLAYESRSFESLNASFKRVLKEDGIILLSEPNRMFASLFFDLLKKEGYAISRDIIPVQLKRMSHSISVYCLSGPAAGN